MSHRFARMKHGFRNSPSERARVGRSCHTTAESSIVSALKFVRVPSVLISGLLFAAFAAFAGTEFPPLPPGYKPALRSPRQMTTTAGQSMSRSVIAPPATNAPAMLVIRGWDTFAGERVPRLALRFGTNAPHATIFTRTYGADWRCFTTLDGIINGSVRDFGWCPTPGSAGNLPAASAQLFKVVLHD